MSKTVAIVDYGVGNIGSLTNSLKMLNYKIIHSNSAAELDKGEIIILPGVGSFRSAMNSIINNNLFFYLKESSKLKPLIGICLGMQLFAKSSEESEGISGLDLIPGTVTKIQSKFSHTGWNSLICKNDNIEMGFEKYIKKSFYFNHSFEYITDNKNIILYSHFERDIAAVVKKNNVMGFQFHPEKSQANGLGLLKYTLDYFLNA